jgi:hypothetical protein
MSDLKCQEVLSVIGRLRDLILTEELDELEPTGPAAVYTTLATVWLMILQRLGGGMSMQAVIKQALTHAEDIFPDRKRVREASLSTRNTAYSDARQRLKIPTVRRLLEAVSGSLIKACAVPGERPVFIVDGTTMTTTPTPELAKAFPPATNQYGNSVWPTVRMLVAHELHSGCALVPEIGPMYGEDSIGEAELLRKMCPRLPADAIVLADAGFGTFGPVWDCTEAGLSIAFRLSSQQFKSLLKKAVPLRQSGPGTSYSAVWKPTTKNQVTNPHIPQDAVCNVVIHTVPFSEVLPGCDTLKQLHIVATPDISRRQAIHVYLRRYDVEHDIRDVKVTLNTEQTRARSREMFEKELLTSLVAYNLVVQFRREAAAKAGVRPRCLSFTGVWNTLQSFLLHVSAALTEQEWVTRYERALSIASKEILRAKKGRSFPRRAHPRRQKTTQTQKAQRKKQLAEPLKNNTD